MVEGDAGLVTPAGGRWQRFVGRVDRFVDRVDTYQQRHRFLAVPGAVVRKYSDDRAGGLTAQISHAAFLAVFPMFLVMFTVLGIVLAGNQNLKDDIVSSALRQFPVVGADLERNIHELSTGNALALSIGLVWLLYGCMRLSRASQVMMAVVWGIPRDELPTFWGWLPRAVGFLLVLGVGFVAGGAAAGLGAFGRFGPGSGLIGFVLSLAVNVGMFWGGFVVVVHIPKGDRAVWPGAVVAGLGWTLLQFAGAQLVNHQLRHLSNLYGTFATVLGLIWWVALGALLTVYAAEFNVVLVRHLWPRSLRAYGGHAAPGPSAGIGPDPAGRPRPGRARTPDERP